MSEAKHTPGPWCVENDDADLGDIPFIPIEQVLDCGGWKLICKVEPEIDDDAPIESAFSLGEVQRSNARLIAAAPELLEALERADGFITNGIALGFIRMPDPETPDPAHEVPKIIKAAIAKAKGETS